MFRLMYGRLRQSNAKAVELQGDARVIIPTTRVVEPEAEVDMNP
ncbi:MAG: hypothetical protein PHV18_05030 [Lachnospiraceae bacterium]|nr:hypothetical protein [Lachnospiraceae bacterium]